VASRAIPQSEEMQMKTRIFSLGSAAGLALAGSLLVAMPSMAQEYPKTSTPGEQAETDALNAQSQSESAAVVRQNEEAARQHERQVQTHRTEVQQHNTELQQHNAAQSAHQAATAQHQRDLANYEAERQRYEVDLKIYEAIMANLEDPRFAILPYPDQRLVLVHTVPVADLEGTLVRDREGDIVGEIADVQGARLMIKMRDGTNIWVRAPRLRYDLDRHVVLTDIAIVDLRRMPRATF
jgi:hypothetical protein